MNYNSQLLNWNLRISRGLITILFFKELAVHTFILQFEFLQLLMKIRLKIKKQATKSFENSMNLELNKCNKVSFDYLSAEFR